jgi:hypothetical protein
MGKSAYELSDAGLGDLLGLLDLLELLLEHLDLLGHLLAHVVDVDLLGGRGLVELHLEADHLLALHLQLQPELLQLLLVPDLPLVVVGLLLVQAQLQLLPQLAELLVRQRVLLLVDVDRIVCTTRHHHQPTTHAHTTHAHAHTTRAAHAHDTTHTFGGVGLFFLELEFEFVHDGLALLLDLLLDLGDVLHLLVLLHLPLELGQLLLQRVQLDQLLLRLLRLVLQSLRPIPGQRVSCRVVSCRVVPCVSCRVVSWVPGLGFRGSECARCRAGCAPRRR